MRRDLCRHGKAAPKGRFDSRFTNFLLTADEEGSRSAHDLRRHDLEIVFPHEPKRDPVTEFRVQAGQPGLDHSWIFSFGEHPDQLEGKPQSLLGIPVELAPLHPPIDGAHILDSADVGCELAADETNKPLDDLRDWEADRFAMRCEIRPRCGDGHHRNLLQTEIYNNYHLKSR
jgi:hypothetical protein